MNQTFSIRPAVASDISIIGHIAETSDLFPAAILPDMIAPFLTHEATDHIWQVACEGDAVVAFVYCEPERMTVGTANMLALATLSNHRSQRVGARLVGNLEQICRERGDRIMLVETSGLPQFARTQSFYKREGYGEVARIPNYYDEGDDKIIFLKRLG